MRTITCEINVSFIYNFIHHDILRFIFSALLPLFYTSHKHIKQFERSEKNISH